MKNKLDIQFENHFDIHEPSIGHFNRFEQKLKDSKKKNHTNWKKFIAIAAILILSIGIIFNFNTTKSEMELADISPKMEETQFYFASVLKEEMKKIKQLENLDNKKIINDALNQINILEQNYKLLCKELTENENSKQLIVAMIGNFNQRIEVLQNLLLELNKHEKIKTTNYEI